MTKQNIENMTKEQYYNMKMECLDSDYYESLDHYYGRRDIQDAWNEWDKFDNAYEVTSEMMWEDESFRFNSLGDYQDYLDECEQLRLYEKQLEMYYEYHHTSFEKPYWMVCVEQISSALKK